MESDLRWRDGDKPTAACFRINNSRHYPELVLRTYDKYIIAYSNIEYYEKREGITNFTKAEDYLNNNYMTEKNWENLCEGDVLIDKRGNERFVLGICGKAILVSGENGINYYGGFTKEEFVDEGWKIKGASEDKPDLESVLKVLTDIDVWKVTSKECGKALNKAIEMLNKLK